MEVFEETKRLAAEAVQLASALGKKLDFSEASVEVVEQLLAQIAPEFPHLSEAAQDLTVERFGCYLLEVGRKAFKGQIQFEPERQVPVLVVGEPDCRIAVITWEKVRARLLGDEHDNIVFFWAGFSTRAKKRVAGSDVLVM
ncbi:MAG: hypothetical protein DI536_02725 [Archangium gephyra]|uniref:Uncharacterized protein n=1 Tax=Archangium gephyra TaxID=48 RepID=A0A2W5TTE1_9BACT|nr:MAG: hypothetical protein DI536_02725 [Archangium gephyra]